MSPELAVAFFCGAAFALLTRFPPSPRERRMRAELRRQRARISELHATVSRENTARRRERSRAENLEIAVLGAVMRSEGAGVAITEEWLKPITAAKTEAR